MSMTLILTAVLLSMLIGVSLGLLGGGGSILTVPILIYALHVPDKSAIASSLLVVGITSGIAALQHARVGNVVWKVAGTFAGAGMVGSFLGAQMGAFIPATVLLVVFALVMFGASIAMWRGRKAQPQTASASAHAGLITSLLLGTIVGVVTGLLGAGGGFLIVPALTLLAGLPMKQSVGTSVVVIALNSFAGFAGQVGHVDIDWQLTALVTGSAIGGSFLGAVLGARVDPAHLRRGFAVFVFAMGLFLMVKQLQHLL